MLSFHSQLKNLRKELGYEENELGVCSIYAQKGIDYWLLGEKGRIAFEKRRDYIKNNYETILQAFKSNQNQQAYLINKVGTFIKRGDYYLNPDEYLKLYGRPLNTNQQLEISKFAQSKKLEKLGGRTQLTSFLGIYRRDELETYIKLLNNMTIDAKADFAISLTSHNHNIALCYNYLQKSWQLIDINHPLLPSISTYDVDIGKTLSDQILESFFHEKTNIVAFDTKIFTTATHQQTLQPLIDKLTQDKEFIALHEVAKEKTELKTHENITLAWLAVSRGDINTLKKIIAINPQLDWNQEDSLGHTLLILATFHGQTEIIKFLLKQRKPDGSYAINLNHQFHGGKTAAYVAANLGYVNSLKLLLEEKNPDGSPAVDANKPTIEGFTPLHAASMRGQIKVLRLMMELIKNNNTALINANALTNSKQTSICLATIYQQEEALKILLTALNSDGTLAADPNKGASPACYAVDEENTTLLQILTEAKHPDGRPAVNLDKPLNGWTPAQLAADNGNLTLLKILAEHGANIDITNMYLSPLKLAQKNKNQPIIDFFYAWKRRNQLLSQLSVMEKSLKYQSQHQVIAELKIKIIVTFHENHEPFNNPNHLSEDLRKIITACSATSSSISSNETFFKPKLTIKKSLVESRSFTPKTLLRR